jgi:hypothetical protein
MTFPVRSAFRVAMAAVMALSLGAMTTQAQKPQSGTEFYLAYKAAFDKAKTIEDIYPFMAAARLAEMKATPAEDRKMMFEMVKSMGEVSGVKVLKETATPTGATLDVEGVGPDKARTTGTITLVKEAGAWKVDKESWKS